VPTRSRQPRIAVPFDLAIVIGRPTSSSQPAGYRWLPQRSNYGLIGRA
jgi:hypothetical protein